MKDAYFEGKVAVVTGAGGTLCSVIAKDLADKGAKVALIGHTKEKLQKVADAINENGGTCRIMTGDVTDEKAMKAIADELQADWGPCRFLVNGAGGNNNKAITTNFYFDQAELSEDKPENMVGFFDLDIDLFGNVVKTNTIGTVVPTRVFARQMAAEGQGAILNFASMNSYRPLTRVPAYAMAKAAIVNLTEWLATYFAPAGMRVNAVAPGFFINDRSIKILGSPETGLTRRGGGHEPHPDAALRQAARICSAASNGCLDDRSAAYVTGIAVARRRRIPVPRGYLTMLLTDYFRSTPDATWEFGRQCGVKHGTIRLPEETEFESRLPGALDKRLYPLHGLRHTPCGSRADAELPARPYKGRGRDAR
ncbi:MAG: SDR family NAD(P)-dependent oxidoreductase [Oscillospiraceae bacterium]